MKCLSVAQCLVCHCQHTENTEEYRQLVEAKSLVKHILERVNEAVRERENVRRTMDMKKRLDKRLLDTTNDPVLSEYKVCNCSVTLQNLYCSYRLQELCCIHSGARGGVFRLYLPKPERIWMKPGI